MVKEEDNRRRKIGIGGGRIEQFEQEEYTWAEK